MYKFNLNESYLTIYKKKNFSFSFFNVQLNSLIRESLIDSFDESFNKDICIFNSESLTNKIIEKQKNFYFLDEDTEKTFETDILIKKLEDFYYKVFKSSANISKLKNSIKVGKFEPISNDKKIYGNILIYASVDETIINKDEFLLKLQQIAKKLGYNLVNVGKLTTRKPKQNLYHLYIQFEATYFNSNIHKGDFLYHVTTKNNAEKILKNGLIPSNKNLIGIDYPDRVYCFTVKNDTLFKDYLYQSRKKNLKFLKIKDKIEDQLENIYDEVISKNEYGILVNDNQYALLQIDTTKLNNIKFFKDSIFQYNINDNPFIAVYTTKTIPAKAISLIKYFGL